MDQSGDEMHHEGQEDEEEHYDDEQDDEEQYEDPLEMAQAAMMDGQADEADQEIEQIIAKKQPGYSQEDLHY